MWTELFPFPYKEVAESDARHAGTGYLLLLHARTSSEMLTGQNYSFIYFFLYENTIFFC